MRRSGECHLKLKIFSFKKTGGILTAPEEAEDAFAVASVPSSFQKQGKAATLLLTLGHFLPCVDKCCRTWKIDICLCGSKVSICSSFHAPDSSISGITTLARAAQVKGSSGYRRILRMVIGGGSLTARFCPADQLWSCQGRGAFNEISLLRYNQ